VRYVHDGRSDGESVRNQKRAVGGFPKRGCSYTATDDDREGDPANYVEREVVWTLYTSASELDKAGVARQRDKHRTQEPWLLESRGTDAPGLKKGKMCKAPTARQGGHGTAYKHFRSASWHRQLVHLS
jgi:hypothetical protein